MPEVPLFIYNVDSDELLTVRFTGYVGSDRKSANWLLTRPLTGETHEFRGSPTVDFVGEFCNWVNQQLPDLGHRLRLHGFSKVNRLKVIHVVYEFGDWYTTHEAKDPDFRAEHSFRGVLQTNAHNKMLFEGARLDGVENNFCILIEVVIVDL